MLSIVNEKKFYNRKVEKLLHDYLHCVKNDFNGIRVSVFCYDIVFPSNWESS